MPIMEASEWDGGAGSPHGVWLVWLKILVTEGGRVEAFSSFFQDMSQKVKEEMELESCQQSNFKNGARLFSTHELWGKCRNGK